MTLGETAKDSIDEVELKALLKAALVEIEDMGLVRAIEEGKLSEDVAVLRSFEF